MASKSKQPSRTRWIGMKHKPTRPGIYEGRDRQTGWVLPEVHWRKLQDETEYGWYTYEGMFGPFRMWKAATNMTAWRGLTAQYQPKEKK